MWTSIRSQAGKNEEKQIFQKNAFKVSGQRQRYRLPLDVFSCQIYNFANFTINQAAYYSERIELSENSIKKIDFSTAYSPIKRSLEHWLDTDVAECCAAS